ncbi:MAG TPA: M1 family peptidase [Hellea balneolensis]|uniref:Aminopeptidase N n=1 Tax=Hellea balneolensis TaxID=287478 RepID=A0A7C3G810_9PROT|nr:M1 family peptidase [Hellea balneolensis]
MSFYKTTFISAIALTLSLSACGNQPRTEDTTPPVQNQTAPVENTAKIIKEDKFTYANYDHVRVTHLALNLDVSFETKTLIGTATLDIKKIDPAAKELVLDTKDLTIRNVSYFAEGAWHDTPFTLDEADELLGQKLSIPLIGDTTKIQITYHTSPKAEGLQWLNPAQTAGKKYPYLFSQAQAINARTIAPLQDTPAVRMTYSATLRVPDALLPLMSAEQGGKNDAGEYTFNMPQPIPSYLLAIAVGDIKFKAINDHIGVYAEDYILDASAEEFSETPLMEEANARLYGPYRWGRYDLIVLPPSFPFGGMENPRLSFMTPTLIAGDKSLTNVVAHELAHSWSGNLATNSSWRDAWLNEGFTSYVENRVMEELYGKNRAAMEQVLSLDDLKRDIKGAERPELTYLKLPADLAHPDDAFSNVAYVKGQFFLAFLEQRFGRDNFDAFLKSYFDHFAFQSLRTEDFVEYLHNELHVKHPDSITHEERDAWIYGPGIPDTFIPPQSDAFDNVAQQARAWLDGTMAANKIKTDDWSTHEWLHFINNLPDTLTIEQFDALNSAFHLNGHPNAEIAFAWYMQAIKGGYDAALPDLERFLMTVGRGKFIYRLYGQLKNNGKADWAHTVYAKARPGYHPIAQRRIDAVLKD